MDAMRLLADRAGVVIPTSRGEATGEASRVDLGRVNAWATEYFRTRLQGSAGAAAREYILSRGFQDVTVERFGLGLAVEGGPSLMQAASKAGFAPSILVAADLLRVDESGRHYETFRNRLMFPIRDATRRVIGFGGRTLVDDRAKYLNTRQTAMFEKGRGLFGLDLAREAVTARGRAVVVEGYTDCMACHQAGFTETVATLGTALTESQVDLIRRYADEVILLFDSDAAGEEAANRAIRVTLPRNARCRLARIPSGKDPAEFLNGGDSGSFSDVLNSAVDALELLWRRTAEKFEASTSNAARREAVLSFLGTVGEAVSATAVDAIQRGLLVNQVAHLLRLEHAEVQRLLSRATKQRKPETPARTGEPAVRRLDAEQAAWMRLWEVVLNEPGLMPAGGALPDCARIQDERVRRIATVAVELGSRLGEFNLRDVQSACIDPEEAAFVAEFARRGAERGNYRATLHGALAQIEAAIRSEERDRWRADFVSGEAAPVTAGGEDVPAATTARGVTDHRHFAPRRMIRAVQGGSTTV